VDAESGLLVVGEMAPPLAGGLKNAVFVCGEDGDVLSLDVVVADNGGVAGMVWAVDSIADRILPSAPRGRSMFDDDRELK